MNNMIKNDFKRYNSDSLINKLYLKTNIVNNN